MLPIKIIQTPVETVINDNGDGGVSVTQYDKYLDVPMTVNGVLVAVDMVVKTVIHLNVFDTQAQTAQAQATAFLAKKQAIISSAQPKGSPVPTVTGQKI